MGIRADTFASRAASHRRKGTGVAVPQPPKDPTAGWFHRRSLGSNFSWLAAGNTLIAACSWGRLVLLARIGNAEMVGQLVLAWAICNPINTLADLGLGGALTTDAKGQYRFADYLGLRLVTSALAMLAVVCTVWAGHYDRPTADLVLLAGLTVALESVCDIFHALLQKHDRMDLVGISLMVRGPLGLVLFTLGTWATGDLRWGVCGFSLAAAGTLLSWDLPCGVGICRHAEATRQTGNGSPPPQDGLPEVRSFRRPMPGLRFRVLLGLAWLSLPLGLATASTAISTSIPRYLVSYYLGREALGAFAVAGSLMVATSLVIGAMSQAAGPRLARHYAAGDAESFARLLRGLLGWVAGVGLFGVILMVVAGGPILRILFGNAFTRFADLAAWLMVAAALRNLSVALGRALSSMRRFRTTLAVRAAGILVLLMLLPGLIASFGLMGAAWGVTASWLTTVLISGGLVLRALGGTVPVSLAGGHKKGTVPLDAARLAPRSHRVGAVRTACPWFR